MPPAPDASLIRSYEDPEHSNAYQDVQNAEACPKCGNPYRGDWDKQNINGEAMCYICSSQATEQIPERILNKPTVAPDPVTALELVGRVPGLTLTLDYTHFARAGLPDAEVEPLLKHASHFHVRGARRGSLQASFKDNTIDFARIVKVMKKTGYRGYLCLEYVWVDWEGCNRVDNLSETILFRDYLRSLMKTS